MLRGISRGSRHCSISDWDGDLPSAYFGQNPSNCIIKAEYAWAGEMAQSVEDLPCMHEDLTLDS